MRCIMPRRCLVDAHGTVYEPVGTVAIQVCAIEVWKRSRYDLEVTELGERSGDQPAIFFQPSRARVVAVSMFFLTASQFTILSPTAGVELSTT